MNWFLMLSRHIKHSNFAGTRILCVQWGQNMNATETLLSSELRRTIDSVLRPSSPRRSALTLRLQNEKFVSTKQLIGLGSWLRALIRKWPQYLNIRTRELKIKPHPDTFRVLG